MKVASLKFWGVRGSIPSPGPNTVMYGGNTSCVEVRTADQIFILDAGTGLRGLGSALNNEFGDRPIDVNILITHTHWDHIQGFPFFGPAYQGKNKVTIYGFEGARQGLQSALSVQMDSPFFPVSLEKMPGKIHFEELKNFQFQIGPTPIVAQFLNHPGTCTGYRIFTRGGSICYLPDVELTQTCADVTKSGESGEAPLANEKLIEFIRGSEVAIIDSQYNPSEYEAHAGWGHSCVEDTVAVAVHAGVKRLYLFHHDPDHSDQDITRILERAREVGQRMQSPLIIEAAREGCELELEEMKQTAEDIE